jgi:hypothetical protein
MCVQADRVDSRLKSRRFNSLKVYADCWFSEDCKDQAGDLYEFGTNIAHLVRDVLPLPMAMIISGYASLLANLIEAAILPNAVPMRRQAAKGRSIKNAVANTIQPADRCLG